MGLFIGSQEQIKEWLDWPGRADRPEGDTLVLDDYVERGVRPPRPMDSYAFVELWYTREGRASRDPAYLRANMVREGIGRTEDLNGTPVRLAPFAPEEERAVEAEKAKLGETARLAPRLRIAQLAQERYEFHFADDLGRAKAAADKLARVPSGLLLSVEEAAVHYEDVAGRQLLPGLLPKIGLGSVFGPSGAAKTLVTLYRALCLANGRPFFGVVGEERVGSLVSPLEDQEQIHLRLQAMARRHDMSTAGVYIAGDVTLNALNPISVTRHINELLLPARDRCLAETGMRLGVSTYDTQRWLMAGKSVNDDEATSMVSLMLRQVSKAAQCVAEVVTHTPLSDDTRQSGVGEQKGARDYEWSVRDGALHLAKGRNQRPRRIGFFEVHEEESPSLHPGSSTMPVLVEVTDTEAAVSMASGATGVLYVDEATAWNERDQNTAFELLHILHGVCRTETKELDGWNYAALGRALSETEARPVADGGPVDVHFDKRYFKPVLHGLRGQGLITDLSETHKSGTSAVWVLTGIGAEWVADHPRPRPGVGDR